MQGRNNGRCKEGERVERHCDADVQNRIEVRLVVGKGADDILPRKGDICITDSLRSVKSMIPLFGLLLGEDTIFVGGKVDDDVWAWNSTQDGNDAFQDKDPSPSARGATSWGNIRAVEVVVRREWNVLETIPEDPSKSTCKCSTAEKNCDSQVELTPGIPSRHEEVDAREQSAFCHSEEPSGCL